MLKRLGDQSTGTKAWRWQGRSVAVDDLAETVRSWRLWVRLAWRDIRGRYRRTVIGPFWTVLSNAILIVTLGVVYTYLWRADASVFLPYFAAGFITWVLLIGNLNECCGAFTGAESIIRSVQLPLGLHIARTITRNVIVFFHSLTIHVAVLIFFGITLPWSSVPLMVIGLFLLVINVFWIGLIVAILNARFRDVTQVVASTLQIAFFITPIFWTPDRLSGVPIAKLILTDLNPVFHLVDVLRGPLIGQPASATTYSVLTIGAVVGFVGALWFFNMFRNRVAYWL